MPHTTRAAPTHAVVVPPKPSHCLPDPCLLPAPLQTLEGKIPERDQPKRAAFLRSRRAISKHSW
jgi:hypothetical protein